jgi:hypothetical protein
MPRWNSLPKRYEDVVQSEGAMGWTNYPVLAD